MLVAAAGNAPLDAGVVSPANRPGVLAVSAGFARVLGVVLVGVAATIGLVARRRSVGYPQTEDQNQRYPTTARTPLLRTKS